VKLLSTRNLTKRNHRIIIDSESDNESEDYSYDQSSNEIEYSSDLDEEFTASFEKISTTRRN